MGLVFDESIEISIEMNVISVPCIRTFAKGDRIGSVNIRRGCSFLSSTLLVRPGN